MRRFSWWAGGFATLLVMAMLTASAVAAQWGANAILHPVRRPPTTPPPSFESVQLAGDGVTLRGWRLRAKGLARGVVVYMHGVADNRDSGIGIARHFSETGLDVMAYDSRAHGESDGTACTYGFYEKRDLIRVLDTVSTRPIVLMGVSLGAAVALQAAADDPRVAGVIGAETFSDLSTVIRERAAFFLSQSTVTQALRRAERDAMFTIDDVSPAAAAARIRAPVLLIHGSSDQDTTADHSRRVL